MNTDPEHPAVASAVLAVRRGDRSAFEPIVRIYQRRLFGLALMMTRDASGAEDVTQDAFIRAFVHLDSYDTRRPFYPWLSTIAVRTAQNWLVRRARTHSREGAELGSAPGVTAVTPDPLNELIADETDRALWRTVSGLPSGERTAVILHYRQGMNVAEIASAVGVTTGTVKTQLFRARRTLRATLDGVRAKGHSR